MISEILNQDLFGVSVEKLAIFFIIITFTFIIKSIFVYVLDKKLTVLVKQTKTELDDLLLKTIKNPLGYLILLHGFYVAILSLQLPDKIGLFDITSIVHAIYILAISFIMLYLIFKIIDIIAYYLYNKAKKTDSTLDDQLVPLLIKSMRILVVTVEDVGFRTTRVRRFDQALVTVPNSQFINTGIINYSSMKKRRINFNLGITYGTSTRQIKEVVAGIKKIIENDEKFEHSFYMVRFNEFGAYSLNIFIYCFTKTPDWAESFAVREEFNLKIMQLLEELGVEIAFPSQTIYLNEKKGVMK